MHPRDVAGDVAPHLRLEVALGAILPLYADIVYRGLVLRDEAVCLGLFTAALEVACKPAHINTVHVPSVLLEIARLFRLERTVGLSAMMPSCANVMHGGFVSPELAFALRPVVAVLRARVEGGRKRFA